MKYKSLMLLAFVLFASACSAETTPAAPLQPTAAPSATAPAFRTEIPVMSTRTDRVAPTLAPTTEPTIAPTDAPTFAPTETLPPTGVPTIPPTDIPATFAPTVATTVAPNTNLAPAVYVTDLKLTPPQPKNKPAEFFFTVSFLNTVGENVNYPRWRVLIFPKGQENTIGDPEGLSKTIVNGASTQNTKAWSIRVANVCEHFVAQPIWEDENGTRKNLVQPDGKLVTLEFQICP